MRSPVHALRKAVPFAALLPMALTVIVGYLGTVLWSLKNFVHQCAQLSVRYTPADVYERPANLFVAGFLGAPSKNFIEGMLDAGGRFTSPCLALAAGPRAGSGATVLGVRPEHIALGADGPFEAGGRSLGSAMFYPAATSGYGVFLLAFFVLASESRSCRSRPTPT